MKLLHLLSFGIAMLALEAGAALPGPDLVKDIAPGSRSGIPDFSTLRAVGNTLLFAATETTHGCELWKSDGTAVGTVLVKDIFPGGKGSDPFGPIVFNGALYFAASDGIHGREFWKSDGTTAGTLMVKDISSGVSGSNPSLQCAVGSSLYFSAYTDTSGRELWKTDGTTAGTVMVADINAGTDSTTLTAGIAVGSLYYFTARHPTWGTELWRTDGTAAGTYLVKDIAPKDSSSSPTALCVSGGVLYFVANDGIHGNELWRSDGTAAGTTMVKDIAPGTEGGVLWNGMTAAGGLVYFSAHTLPDSSDWSIWRSDGTSVGTYRLLSVSNPQSSPMKVVENNVFFRASVAGGPYQVWKSNGTVAGTAVFKPGMTAGLDYLIVVGKNFYFGESRTGELWQSDGSPAGTYQVADLSAGSTLYNAINPPSLLAGRIHFDASRSQYGNELYAYDIAPPSVSRPEVSGRTKTGARIDFAVNPNGLATTAVLEHGPTDSYGTTVNLAVSPAGGNSSFQAFSIPISGLSPGTTHHYRITATSARGSRVSTGTFDTVFTREDWRSAHFGSTENLGIAADGEDPDHDGLSNLLEYAFGLDPLTGDVGGVPKGSISAGGIVLNFTQPPGIEDIAYGVEWSTTMAPGSWQAASDTGSGNLHSFKVSTIWQPRMFCRWTVTLK